VEKEFSKMKNPTAAYKTTTRFESSLRSESSGVSIGVFQTREIPPFSEWAGY